MSKKKMKLSILTRWYEQYYKLLMKMATDILDNEDVAEDMVQDTFKRIIEKFDKLKDYDEESRIVYVTTVVRNLCIDYKRKSIMEAQYFENLEHEAYKEVCIDDTTLEIYNNKNLRLDLGKYLHKMEKREAMLIVGRYLWDMSYREIGEMLNIKESHVPSYMARAITKLRKMMKEEV